MSKTIIKPNDISQTVLPEHGQWFVLHTRSRQEKVVAGELAAMNIGCYLPMVEMVRSYGRRKTKVQLPLFSGYVFLRGTSEQAYLADRTKRIAQIITVNDQSQIDWELRNLHLALSKSAPLDPYPYLKEGMRVEVRSGPFRNLQGVVESRLKMDRLLLQIEMLGRSMSLEVDPSMVEPTE